MRSASRGSGRRRAWGHAHIFGGPMDIRLQLSPLALALALASAGTLASSGPSRAQDSDLRIVADCLKLVHAGARPLAEERNKRFEGKVGEEAADCRGGGKATVQRAVPWVDWSNYWGAADAKSKAAKTDRGTVPPLFRHLVDPNGRGLDGALMDLEYQRMELIKFNLFDNKTYDQYVSGRKVDGRQVEGPLLRIWKEMRLEANSPNINDVIIDPRSGDQTCKGAAVRFRTVNGICNDIKNPAMGS